MQLEFIQAGGYSSGRGSYPLHFIVMHSTESGTAPGTAYNLASWFHTQYDTSAHAIFDPSKGYELVKPNDTAWHCGNGNQGGYGIEMCGRASMTRSEWMAIDSELRLAAQWAAQIANQYGIPARHLTIGELAGRNKGFCTHNDVRLALGGTTHTDPGDGFPMDVFLGYVAQYMGGGAPSVPPVHEQTLEEWMASNEDKVRTIVRSEINNALRGLPDGVIDRFNDRGREGTIEGVRIGLGADKSPNVAQIADGVWDEMNARLRKDGDALWRLADAVVRRLNQQGRAHGLVGFSDGIVDRLNDRGYSHTVHGLGEGLGTNPPAKAEEAK